MDKKVKYPICTNCGKPNDCDAGIYCFRCGMIKITTGKLPEREDTMPDDIAKVLSKKEPHLIRISYAGDEPDTFKFEREEEHDGVRQMVTYLGDFTTRQVKARR